MFQPILVRPYGDKYEVVEGAHRLEAAREAKLEEVPCLIKELTDHEVTIIQLKAQALRPEMKAADYARRLQELIDSEFVTLESLAAEIGKSVVWIRGVLKLDKLCLKARTMVNRGEIKLTSAKSLARLPRGLQEKFLDQAVILPVDEFASLVRENLKQYREMIKKGRVDNFLLRMADPQPYLRSMKEIRKEAKDFQQAGTHIKLQGATTALDGWKACLIWLLHLDPVSLKEHSERSIRAQAERLNAINRRKQDRDLKFNLLGDAKNE
jgi:ParB/RepB/Spo0J family partition protein